MSDRSRLSGGEQAPEEGFDVTKTYSYEHAELVAFVSPDDYRRGMAYAQELIRALWHVKKAKVSHV